MSREDNLGEAAACGRQWEELFEGVESRIQDLQWRTVFNSVLPVFPVLAKKLRDVAQEGEQMATQVSSQFLHIAEKIGASYGPHEGDGTFPRFAAEPLTTSSEAIVPEISRIIVDLQFQDVASQRIGNLARILDEIGSVLSGWVSASPEYRQDANDLVRLAWTERIRSIRPNVTYTVKEPLAGYLVSSDEEDDPESHDEIELFSK